MTNLGRRAFLTGITVAAGTAATSSLGGARASAAPALVRTDRLTLPSGVQTGDVTTKEGVLWARSSGPGRLMAQVSSGRHTRLLRGGLATDATDQTARLPLQGLTPGREYDAALWFEDENGNRGEVQRARFGTASHQRRGTSFVWTGDTCGQGWGINPDLGGMTGYRAMAQTRPDFFVHAGDTIYADGPLQATVTEPDGKVWRNIVTPEVSKVAESLTEFRGRHRYNQLDQNIRAMYAEVPVLAQWDDHETHNNWYPGQILTDDRYTERRVDVLAARARQAWQENMPIAVRRTTTDGFAPERIYRKIARGRHLDVFLLDMRSYKDPNTAGTEPQLTHILGQEQADWLIREVSRSTATWKVISADLPLGLVVADGPVNEESLSNRDPGKPLGKELEIARVLSGLKRNRVRNVVWITADVHYCAAHHYAPERAAFTDFDPFWEIVAGPIAAGSFGPNDLDATFGPKVVFQKTADYPNQSPRGGNQFFGHIAIADDGRLTASLRNSAGAVLWSQDLEPQRR
ncbi:alkaline phosphatase [Calidifontibacter sp. DB0510]|uniref:Alkaline phosphatase n=1 Tax=Metallococcus carri TaxID=1656884 RepID=A0A967EB55_9MICO|nr:alkaline phosphatase D family protein [Metallococcus carri]NHN56955.1 alkaline phosphatase [Metallococcus carri]NOP37700.1 alkaline phosphatase [Calidifontibacter sp. DB2511S]